MHPERVLRGEASGRAVVTEEIVKDMRSRHAAGSTTIASIAREYGVGESTVRNIIQRNTWKHVL